VLDFDCSNQFNKIIISVKSHKKKDHYESDYILLGNLYIIFVHIYCTPIDNGEQLIFEYMLKKYCCSDIFLLKIEMQEWDGEMVRSSIFDLCV
jgi:hypothetical protein